MQRLGGIISLLSLAAGIIGIWFFFTERSYAANHGSNLAGVLQWVGIAIALLGVAGFLMGMVIVNYSLEQRQHSMGRDDA